jgi:hypothetical protein
VWKGKYEISKIKKRAFRKILEEGAFDGRSSVNSLLELFKNSTPYKRAKKKPALFHFTVEKEDSPFGIYGYFEGSKGSLYDAVSVYPYFITPHFYPEKPLPEELWSVPFEEVDFQEILELFKTPSGYCRFGSILFKPENLYLSPEDKEKIIEARGEAVALGNLEKAAELLKEVDAPVAILKNTFSGNPLLISKDGIQEIERELCEIRGEEQDASLEP